MKKDSLKDGVIYIAFGNQYVAEAAFSAQSLKRHSPSLPVALFTDIAVSEKCFDQVIVIDPSHKRAKVDFISRSPFDRTLYLDSDTEIAMDISDIFQLLDRFDIAATQDFSRKSSRWASKIPEYNEIPYAFSEYNGGVMLYKKCESVDRFFELWQKYFHKYKLESNGQDQPSLRVAAWKSDVSIHVLPFEYNVRNAEMRNKVKKRAKNPEDQNLLKPRIFHWHGLNTKRLFSRFRDKYRPAKF